MNQKKFQPGFTLIEILVAITIFSIIVGVISGSFVLAINLQKRVLAYQELFDTTSYIIEYMTRYLRMAKKDLPQGCLGSPIFFNNCENNNEECVKFLDPLKTCSELYLENQIIKRTIFQDTFDVFDLTSTTTLEIISVKFKIQLPQNNDTELQPRLTFPIIIKSPKTEQIIRIQTTVSPKMFNIKTQN